MNLFTVALILGLSVSADALACGFAAGASRLKIPVASAMSAAAVSAAFVAFGMTAGCVSAPFIPDSIKRYMSFFVLAVLGALKLAVSGDTAGSADFDSDKRLSVPEALALGSAISLDGLAVGCGYMASAGVVVCATLCTFAFTTAALYFGAKGGMGVKPGRIGNITAGLALIVLAAIKLI